MQYNLETAPQQRRTPRRIVVVGAGIVGAALAWELARRGAAVTVLDAAREPDGATPKSFAWITNQSFFRAVDAIPEPDARHYFGLHRLALGAWRRLQREIGDELTVRWEGCLQWSAGDEEERERLVAELERRQRWGSPSYPIDRDELQRRLPGASVGEFDVGFFAPDEGAVDPLAAARTLLAKAVEQGATACWSAPVTGFGTTSSGEILVHFDGGSVVCDSVVVAAGRQTPDVAALLGVDVPLIETNGQLVHLEPIEMFLGPIAMSPHVHALQRWDGRVVLGRHFTGHPVSDGDELDVDGLVADAVAMFPQLTGVAVERVTNGRRILPADGLPIVGTSERFPGAHVIATNAGVSLGPVLAQLLTTEILDGKPVDVLDRYRAQRFVDDRELALR